jgi:hypothetical protein
MGAHANIPRSDVHGNVIPIARTTPAAGPGIDSHRVAFDVRRYQLAGYLLRDHYLQFDAGAG